MNVSVRYLVNFSVVTGKKNEDILLQEGATLQDLIDQLIEKYGSTLKKEIFLQTGEIKPHVLILINGRSLDQFKEKSYVALANGDSIIFTFPVTGG
jgi:MoaD family protein